MRTRRDEGSEGQRSAAGKQPKLKPNQAKYLLELRNAGAYIQAELAELFGVGRSTIYRTINRMRPQFVEPERPFGRLVPPNTQTSAPQNS
jgi:DNA invertase Pin-like site-specific DNA recombinase